MFKSRPSAGKIICSIWLILASLYTVYGIYSYVSGTLIRASYVRGRAEAVAQVIQEAQKCQPFPVNVGEVKTTLVSLDCQKPAQGSLEQK